MKIFYFFILASSLQADLYDRNKYNLDFRPEDQVHEVHPHRGPHHRECPCDPGDPQCPCEIDEHGNYHRVD